MPRQKKHQDWDAERLTAILGRMRDAYTADDPKHCLSLLDALEIVAMEEIGYNADKVFKLIKTLRTELEKEIPIWERRQRKPKRR
jgi:hypothetical protein